MLSSAKCSYRKSLLASLVSGHDSVMRFITDMTLMVEQNHIRKSPATSVCILHVHLDIQVDCTDMYTVSMLPGKS